MFHNIIKFNTKIVKGESRDKRKTQFLTFGYAEPPPVLFKDSERRELRQTKNAVFNFLAMPGHLLSYSKIEYFSEKILVCL